MTMLNRERTFMAKPTKEQKRESIMIGALKLFSKDGFHATTIPDIAKALDR